MTGRLASAQTAATASPQGHQENPSEIVFTTGSSVGNIHVFAYASDRRINPVGIEYDCNCLGHFLHARIDYVAEFQPAVLLDEPASYGVDSAPLTGNRVERYGVGVFPIGARLHWRPNRAVQPYLIGKGGILIFDHTVLSAEASRVNESAQFGAGVECRIQSRWGLRIGYSDLHFSDGDITAHNPGIDFMYLNAGVTYSFRRSAR